MDLKFDNEIYFLMQIGSAFDLRDNETAKNLRMKEQFVVRNKK